MLIPSAKAKIIKVKRCKAPGCDNDFMPQRPRQRACCPTCALSIVAAANAKKVLAAAKLDRKETKAKLEKVKSTSTLKAEARTAFHAYIRARDVLAGLPCICCGKPFEPQRPGGSVDAGHYLSRGSHPNLAFSETNTNAQRKNCNRPGGTTAAAFRLGMIARYDLATVEALESDTEPRRFRADDYREIRRIYREKLCVLKLRYV